MKLLQQLWVNSQPIRWIPRIIAVRRRHLEEIPLGAILQRAIRRIDAHVHHCPHGPLATVCLLLLLLCRRDDMVAPRTLGARGNVGSVGLEKRNGGLVPRCVVAAVVIARRLGEEGPLRVCVDVLEEGKEGDAGLEGVGVGGLQAEDAVDGGVEVFAGVVYGVGDGDEVVPECIVVVVGARFGVALDGEVLAGAARAGRDLGEDPPHPLEEALDVSFLMETDNTDASFYTYSDLS